MSDTHVGALLVAAGRGTRMQLQEHERQPQPGQKLETETADETEPGDDPKQFRDLAGRKVVCYSLQVISSSPLIDHVVVVVPPGWESRMHAQCVDEQLNMDRVRVAVGGATRQDSVRCGLAALPPCDHVIVHDAARPFVSQSQIERVLVAARAHGAATIALPVTDTLVRVPEEPDAAAPIECVDRHGVWAVQTPQAFERSLLERAHARAQAHGTQATDDGSLVLALGHRLDVVAGSWRNIKITSPEDLQRARWILDADVSDSMQRGR